MSSRTDTFGNWYSGAPVFMQNAESMAAKWSSGLWQPLAPVPVTYSVQLPVTVTYASSVTATAQSSRMIQYIADTYGGHDQAVSASGIAWRTRPLTLAELMG